MSQTENAVTSSSGTKRAYRKGNPLTLAERQQASLARKRATHKELRVFIPAALKAQLQVMCEVSLLTCIFQISAYIFTTFYGSNALGLGLPPGQQRSQALSSEAL